MPIEFYCPECNRILRVGDADAGREANCPGCDRRFVVPTPTPTPISADDRAMAATLPYPAPDGAPARIVPTEIDVIDVLSTTWEIFKRNALFLIGAAILVFVINGIGVYAGKTIGGGIVGSLANLVIMAIGFFLGIGITKILLEVARGRPAELGMLLSGQNVFLPVLGGWILFTLLVAAGLVLFIIPGIVLALVFGQHYFLIIDRQLAVLDSFSASKTITSGNRLALFALWAVGLIVTSLAGVITFGVAFVVVGPYFALSGTVAYLMMCGEISDEGWGERVN